jgi:RNA polymerase sigma-70 factor (ECF subfamily)
MEKNQLLAEEFESNRSRLQEVAYRMLGDLAEADDAVQEAWLHLSRSDASSIGNLGGWLTTVVARICLDMLRSRKSRREESLDAAPPDQFRSQSSGADPEQEAVLADSVGLALLVVLDTLDPAERLAFVLHDVFAMPFNEIARVVDRSEPATRQLASRARRRVRGGSNVEDADLNSQRELVDAFLTASRTGNFSALLAVLDPQVVFRHDPVAIPRGRPAEIVGADAVAREFAGRAQGARPILINDSVGILVAPRGHLRLVLEIKTREGRIVEMNVVSNPERLSELDLKVLDS